MFTGTGLKCTKGLNRKMTILHVRSFFHEKKTEKESYENKQKKK